MQACGSQVPAVVADSVRDYMLSSYVQLGASYPISLASSRLVDETHGFVKMMMNGKMQNFLSPLVTEGSGPSVVVPVAVDAERNVRNQRRQGRDGPDSGLPPAGRASSNGSALVWQSLQYSSRRSSPLENRKRRL